MKATKRPSGVMAGQSQMALVTAVCVRSTLAITVALLCASQTATPLLMPSTLVTNATKRASGVMLKFRSFNSKPGRIPATFVFTISVNPEAKLYRKATPLPLGGHAS